MKCKKIQITYSDTPPEERPSAVRRHLETCSACRTWFQQCRDLRSLVGFKRYEQPAPEVEGRILYNVRTRLEAMEALAPQPESGGWRIGLRYATLAALALVVFANIHLMRQAPPENAGVAAWNTGGEPEIAVAQIPLLDPAEDPTRLFFEDPMGFGFALPAAHTNFVPVRRPAPAGTGNFQFIDYRP